MAAAAAEASACVRALWSYVTNVTPLGYAWAVGARLRDSSPGLVRLSALARCLAVVYFYSYLLLLLLLLLHSYSYSYDDYDDDYDVYDDVRQMITARRLLQLVRDLSAEHRTREALPSRARKRAERAAEQHQTWLKARKPLC